MLSIAAQVDNIHQDRDARMAWRLRMKLRKAPAGVELISEKLEEFEQRMREALNAPMDDKRRNELSWPMHKIHYEKNRYLHDMHYKHHSISKKLLDYLAKEKLCDGKLIAKWRKQGYERLCSLLAITKSNTNFRTVSVCRTPLRDRTGQIMPNMMTGCVSCASGDGGPIWWDDPVPDIVKRRIAAIDPGKQDILEGAKELREGGPEDGGLGDGEARDVRNDERRAEQEILARAKKLREKVAPNVDTADTERDGEREEEILNHAKRLREGQSGKPSNSGPVEENDDEADEEEIMRRAKRLRQSMAHLQSGASASTPKENKEGSAGTLLATP